MDKNSPGNASNPAPDRTPDPEVTKSMYNSKAEKYIREAGNIEDLPDAEEDQKAQKALNEKKED